LKARHGVYIVAGFLLSGKSETMNHEVLVLNSDYEPLNICTLKRAFALVFLGKVEVLQTDTMIVRTVNGAYESPSVLRLRQYVRRPRLELRLSRRSILARDNYACQYCGTHANDLTVDHVIPKRLGGPTAWENLVCCCKKCNTKKGDKTLSQVGFSLIKQPKRPRYIPFISLNKYLESTRNESWRAYLPVFDTEPERTRS